MENCQRCKQEDQDLRTLSMACFYEMDELNMPFTHKIIMEADDTRHKLYQIRVCKPCRSFWMGMIKIWFDMPTPTEPGCGSGIYIKDLGSVREITEEEFHRRQKQVKI